jgi:dienelactone hydrolase
LRLSIRSLPASVRLAALFSMVLVASAGAATPAKPADPGASMIAAPTVEASEEYGWSVPIRIANTATMGLYVDSLTCDLEDTSAGETRSSRQSRTNLRILISQIESLSSGDSVTIQYQSPAQFEKGTLDFTLYAHRGNKEKITLKSHVEAQSGVMAAFPSRTAIARGHKVEWVYMPSNTGVPSPGVVIVHGHASHARMMMRAGQLFVNQGYSVALVSMPGYGLSEGPADLMGPQTVAAVSAAMDSFVRMAEVDRKRLGVIGVSRGATVAAELAASRKDVRAVLCQSGIYDLWAVYRETSWPGFKEAIVAEAGPDSAAWKARSPVTQASAIKVPIYVLHGAKDKQIPVDQAQAFEGALKAAGAPVESQYMPTLAHQIAVSTTYKTGLGFFGRTLK